MGLLLWKVGLGVSLAADLLLSALLGVAMHCFFGLDFRNCAGTELLLSVVRVPLVVAVVVLGARWGAPAPELETESGAKSKRPAKDESDGAELASLMDESDGEDTGAALLQQQSTRRWVSAEWCKRGALGALFLASTASQLVLGVKSVSAPLAEPAVSRAAVQTIVCLLLLALNAQLYAGRAVLNLLTQPETRLVPRAHQHPLVLRSDVGWARCDRCHQRINGGRSFSCAACDWDVCPACLKKDAAALPTEEGQRAISRRDYLRNAWQLVRPHALLVGTALLLLLLRQAAVVALPSFTGSMLDSIIRQDTPSFRSALFYFVCVNVGLGLVAGCARLCLLAVAQQMEQSLRTRLFERILGQGVEYFDGATTGDLLAKLHDDTRSVLAPVKYTLSSVLGAALGVVGGLAMCLRVSWRLSMLSVTVLGPLTMVTAVYSAWASGLWSRVWGISSTLQETARESFSLIRTIRAFGREEAQAEEYRRNSAEKRRLGMLDAWATGGSAALAQYLELALQALVMTYGGLAILEHTDELTVGALVTFQLYWAMLSSGFQNLFDQLGEFSKAAGAAQRVLELLERLPEVDPDAGEPIGEGGIGDIELNDVWFRYKARPDTLVLRGVSLRIPRGSVVALVGRSGGGKSTIVALLAGAYVPTKGAVRVAGGRDLRDVRQRDYRSRLGVVQQDTELFNCSVERNICYGVGDDYTQDQLMHAAREANCLDFVAGFEEGFATKVGERGVKISGGQKQRIALARVLIKRPELLLLDEATSALDSESEHQVQLAIDRLLQDAQRPTVLLVAHRLSTVMAADLICVVDGGVIAEQGSHAQLLARGGIYARLVQRQLAAMGNTLAADSVPAAALASSTGGVIDDLFD